MNIDTRSNPVFFLLLFALISLLLLPLWNEIGDGYLASLSSIVNHTNLWLGLPSEFAIQPHPREHTITPALSPASHCLSRPQTEVRGGR